MRELFKNKYKRGYEQGNIDGWNAGFSVGTSKALAEAKKVFVKRIQKEIKETSSMVDREYLDGLERAIDLIRKGK